MKKGWRREERSEIEEDEFAIYDWVWTNHRWKLEEVGVHNKNKELMDKENSIRYLRINWMYAMTEYQVQIENHILLRKLSRDNWKPKGIIPNVNKVNMQQ
jgi:hypothetical protein